MLARSGFLLFLFSLLVPQTFAQPGVITTVAGSTPGFGGDGGPATAAHLLEPRGIAFDKAGNLYIADLLNNEIRKVNTAGVISIFAGSIVGTFSGDGGPAVAARLNHPMGVAFDSGGNLYIADFGNGRVRKVTPEGIITTVAGIGTSGFSGDGGPATAARLVPAYIKFDSHDNLYISDVGNHRIRKVTPAGIISTVAGNGDIGFSGDGGPATAATLNSPEGIAFDSSDNLYIADSGNNRIRKVTLAGIISTVTVQVDPRVVGTQAVVPTPTDIAIDAVGTLFVGSFADFRIRKVTASSVSVIAGTGTKGLTGDGGPATAAQIGTAYGLALDAAANLYLSDDEGGRVRKITSAGLAAEVRAGSFAQIASGGGWKTTLTLVNLNSTTVTGRIHFYGDEGSPLSLPITFPQFGGTTSTTSFVDLAIVPNGSLTIESEASGPLATGWADVLARGSLTGYTIFRFRQPGIPDSEGTATLDSRGESSIVFPFDNTSGFRTGIAIANQSSAGSGFTAIVRDDSGAQLGRIDLVLAGSGHRAFFLEEGVPQSANRRGIVEIQNASGGITGVGLRFNTSGSFTSIPFVR